VRTIIDIPEEAYRSIKALAAQLGTTVPELVLKGVELVRRQPQTAGKRFAVPVIRSNVQSTLEHCT
jgi:hypothetical protein